MAFRTPIPRGWHPCRTQSGRHADCPVRRAPATATARARGWAKHAGRAWHCWFRAIATTGYVVYEGARAQGRCSAPVRAAFKAFAVPKDVGSCWEVLDAAHQFVAVPLIEFPGLEGV